MIWFVSMHLFAKCIQSSLSPGMLQKKNLFSSGHKIYTHLLFIYYLISQYYSERLNIKHTLLYFV